MRIIGAVLILSLSGCSLMQERSRPEPVDKPKPVETMPTSWTINVLDRDTLPNLEIINTYGIVTISPAQTNNIEIELMCRDGAQPKHISLAESNGWHRFHVLDDARIADDPKPETPTLTHDGMIYRLHTRMSRCDVVARVPEGTRVEVRACAKLEVDGSASIIARAGSGAHVRLGEGSLKLWIGDGPLLVEHANYDVEAEIGGHAEFHSVVGDKDLRGKGNVIVHGGHGLLNVDIDGDLWSDSSLTAGYAQGTSMGGGGEGGITPIGPRGPEVGVEQQRREPSRTRNVIKARQAELHIPAASALDVEARATDGLVELDVPDEANAVFHERSPASARFTLGNAEGELSVTAMSRAEIVVLKP